MWGRQARYLISEQPWDFAFGRGSALDRFHEIGGKILLIGCDHDTVTFLHLSPSHGYAVARFIEDTTGDPKQVACKLDRTG